MRFLAGVLAVGLGVGAVSGALAQGASNSAVAKRPMTFADLMAMKRVSDPQVSASGKWVMFSVTEVSLEQNSKANHLWVVPVAGGKEVQVTSGKGESGGRFSPDGKWVSWTADDADGTSQIWLAGWDDAAGKVGEARQLTRVSTGADGAVWSPDARRMLVVSSVYPECSDKVVWAEENACDKAKDDAAAKDPVKGQVWDSLLYRHWDHFTGEKRSHVLVVNAADGSDVRDLTPKSAVGTAETPTWTLGGPVGYAWAPDSKEIAYVTNLDAVPAASTNNDVFTLRLDEAGAKAVKVSTSPGSDDAPAYSPDGKWLAFRSQAREGFESDKFRLMLFDRATETMREVLPKFDRWVDEFVWASDSKAIYFASGDRGSEPIFSVGIDGTDLSLRTNLDRYAEWGEFGELNLHSNLLVATRSTVTRPSEVFLLHLGVDSGVAIDDFGYAFPGYKPPPLGTRDSARPSIYKIEQVTKLNDKILSEIAITGITELQGIQPLEPFEFPGADGTKVQGFILRPPGFDASKKYPVKFLMHGGPQTAWGDSWSYRWNWELMAASGYVVVGINRRGSTGYGQKFVDEISGDWGGKAYEDLMKGLDYAEAHYAFLDKTRECALGASYGGYMADWVLTHTNRFQCIVTHDGMYDATAAYGSTEEMWFNEWEFRRGPATGAAAWDTQPAQPWRYSGLPAAEDPFRKWSPSEYIKNAKTPTLVIHSQRDYRLDVSQGFALFTALQRLGMPSRFLYFPDESHWVLKPKNSELWYETVGDWCDKWTKSGKYASAGAKQ